MPYSPPPPPRLTHYQANAWTIAPDLKSPANTLYVDVVWQCFGDESPCAHLPSMSKKLKRAFSQYCATVVERAKTHEPGWVISFAEVEKECRDNGLLASFTTFFA